MPECAITHLQQCRISKSFWGGSPDRTPGREGGGREGCRPLASGPQNHNPPLLILKITIELPWKSLENGFCDMKNKTLQWEVCVWLHHPGNVIKTTWTCNVSCVLMNSKALYGSDSG